MSMNSIEGLVKQCLNADCFLFVASLGAEVKKPASLARLHSLDWSITTQTSFNSQKCSRSDESPCLYEMFTGFLYTYRWFTKLCINLNILTLVLAMEAREEKVVEKAERLQSRFAGTFCQIVMTLHPIGLEQDRLDDVWYGLVYFVSGPLNIYYPWESKRAQRAGRPLNKDTLTVFLYFL